MKKVGLFFLFGILQFAVDSSIYTILSAVGLNLVLANIISRGSAALLGYFINGRYTFNKDPSASTFFKFCIYWLIMTALSSSILWAATEIYRGMENVVFTFVSKILVELLLFFISFILAKKMVFNNGNDA
jgi:putative flippase GtrA